MIDRGEDLRLDIPETFNFGEAIIDGSAEKFGDKTAVICVGSQEMGIKEESITFEELRRETNRAANLFMNHGVSHDDRILLILPDSIEFYLAFYGAIKLGAIPVPVNTYLSREDYRYFLEDSRAKFAIIGDHFMDSFPATSKFLKGYLGAREFREMLSDYPQEFEPVKLSKDAMAFWLYSSGTTGKPKGVVHLQHDLLYVAEGYHKRVLGLNETDICYSVSKLFFAFGLNGAGCGTIYCGATTIVDPERVEPERAVEIMRKYGVTVLYTVPNFYSRLTKLKETYSGLRLAVSAGEPLPAGIWRRFRERFGAEIVEHIGSTEVCGAFIGSYPGKVRPGYTGVALPGWEIRLLDEEGNDVPDGKPGRVYIKGEAVSPFYWEKHEETKKTFIGEWYYTGDVMIREGGYYRYVGRADDLIKTRGLWVSPIKIESVMAKHSAVIECAVVQGFSDEGIEVVSAYVNIGDYDRETFIKEMKDMMRQEGLKGYEIPEKWVFVDDLPKTATGKIQRYKLRERERMGVV